MAAFNFNSKYQVFLSFRGEDTRNNFTDHLYAALWRKGIVTFKDDEELKRGEVIKGELLQAIDESLCAVVILSPNYASSSWCLDELQKILESREALGRWVLPIFYGVDPSEVRHQTGSFGEVFKRNEERFQDRTKVQRWREALSQVASLSGYESKNRRETELINEILTVLWTKLEGNFPLVLTDGLIGIETKLEDMYRILEIGSTEICFVGIWGMGGIGKTTLAKLVFNKFYSHFDICYYIENVRENSSGEGGQLSLQAKILSQLTIKELKIYNLDQGKAKLRYFLSQKKALLVLDDVDDLSQLENLAGNLDWFGQGSRIIVTTRDAHLLVSHEVPFKKYEIKVLNSSESLELFCHKAFKRDKPKKGYLELSQSVVHYCKGLPLALKILGSHLCERDVSTWEDALNKLRKSPPKSILDRLRISYDGLEDNEKSIFLDIACLFMGWHKNRVMHILEHCGFNHEIGIDILTERSLLNNHNEVILMHDLLQEMGRRIVIQNSNNEISKQSRLWSHGDIDEVLVKKKGTEFTRGVVLETNKYEAHWDPKAFSKMSNLRLLIILNGLQLPLGLKCLSNSIKVLEWNECPLNSLPLGVELNKLVELKMCRSKIKQLWNGNQNFENLKIIDMSYSEDFVETPNLSGAPNLESLIFEGCLNLLKIHQSIAQLKKLLILNLKGCVNLKCLPRKLETSSLKDFILYGCSNIKKLPEFGDNMNGISNLDLRGCKNLDSLPNSIWNLKYLKNIDLSGCSKFFGLPEIMIENKALERLDLSETSMKEIPSFISHFQNLKWLSVRGCGRPMYNSWWKFWAESVPMGLNLAPLSCLHTLRELDASYCNLIDKSIPSDFCRLSSLEILRLSGNNFVNPPRGCISNLRRLWYLELDYCPKLQTLPVFPLSLREVRARNCGPMEVLPDIEIWKLLMSHKVYTERRAILLGMSGNEIPAWFDKQQNLPHVKRKFDQYVSARGYVMERKVFLEKPSIIVDIPDYLHSSEWWGVVVCFLVEPIAYPREERTQQLMHILSSIAAPQDAPPSFEIGCSLGLTEYEGLNRHHLFILFLDGSSPMIQKVLRNHGNQFKLFFYLASTGIDFQNNLCIRRCGWRVICKNDAWRTKARIPDFENVPSHQL